MATQKGRTLLIKYESTEDSGTFDTIVCGFRSRSYSIGSNVVDTTKPDCTTPSNMVVSSGVYGIRTLSFSGSGLAEDTASFLLFKNCAFNQTVRAFQIVWPGDGTYTGDVLITSFEVSGDTEGELEFSCDLQFTGAVTYVAE